ncbi:MAG: RNA methyltransferase [Puniceicoccales bacterium]|jgi:TrmH family RNA methyltransferase|nr:RNA methyltransferase [Puniceicoccales bacterium]
MIDITRKIHLLLPMDDILSSRKNPRIQFLDKLKKRSARDEHKLYLVEGLRELMRAYQAHCLREIYCCPAYFSSPEYHAFRKHLLSEALIPVYEVSAYAFEKISLREGMDGLMGIGLPLPSRDWQLLDHLAAPLLLVVDHIEKPGNLGAMMRSADAVGADAMIVLDPSTDLYNPHCIRASQGAIFSIPVILTHFQEWEHYSQTKEWQWIVMTPHAKVDFWSIDMTRATAIILGSEKDGLADHWFQHSLSKSAKIPQRGLSDSLNVSVAAAVALYEAVRQRTYSATDVAL